MKKLIASLGSLLVVMLQLGTTAQGALTNEQLVQKVEMLESRLHTVEAELAGNEAPAATEIVNGIEIGGGISTNYTYNFNDPDSRANTLRVFDNKANSFDVDDVELFIQKDSEELGIGGRIDLDFLETADVITPFGTSDDDFDVQQAFVYYVAPIGSGLTLKAGKFVTPIGAEVIEPWDNWNFSRSFLFGYAIPFTHTGITGGYTFNEFVTATIGVVNGWDNVEDNNDTKTLLGSVVLGPWEWVSLAINGTIGGEQANEDDNLRGLIDLILTIKPEPIPQLTVLFNYDYGNEEDVPSFDAGGTTVVGSSDATWQGLAGYAKYEFCERSYAALRAEWFEDEDGARTGAAQELWEITLTGAYMIAEGMWVKLEYRHDDSDADAFQDGASASDTQDTISSEVLYVF
jgi:hypothetical protein